MRAQPGAARLPREPCGWRALDRRRDISLVGPRVVALVRRVDHERLKREPAIVALIQLAPGIADLVLVARPRAGGGDARVGRRMPLGLAGRLPLVAPVLLPVAVGVTAAERSEEHTSELQSQSNLVCRLLLEKKKKTKRHT